MGGTQLAVDEKRKSLSKAAHIITKTLEERETRKSQCDISSNFKFKFECLLKHS